MTDDNNPVFPVGSEPVVLHTSNHPLFDQATHPTAMDDRDIERILRGPFAPFTPTLLGASNQIFLASNAVLKISNQMTPSSILWERRVLEMLPAAVGAPTLLAGGWIGDREFLLTTRMGGTPLGDVLRSGELDRVDTAIALRGALGRLDTLHRTVPSRAFPPKPLSPLPWWRQMWTEPVYQDKWDSDLEYLQRRGFINRRFRHDLEDAYGNLLPHSLFCDEVDESGAAFQELMSTRLLHGEPHVWQFLYDKDQTTVSTLLDWEMVFAGPKILDYFHLMRGVSWAAPDLELDDYNRDVFARIFPDPFAVASTMELLLLARNIGYFSWFAHEHPEMTGVQCRSSDPSPTVKEVADLLHGRSFYRRIANELLALGNQPVPPLIRRMHHHLLATDDIVTSHPDGHHIRLGDPSRHSDGRTSRTLDSRVFGLSRS